MFLIVDNRENCKDKLKQVLGDKVLFENLLVGDFEIRDNENKALVIVERKTTDDLVASIIDGRYKEQKSRLLGNYKPEQLIYIVEGSLSSDYKVNILSAVISTSVRDRISVINTHHVEETIKILLELYKKIGTANSTLNQDIDYATVLASSISISKKQNLDAKAFFIGVLSCVPGISGQKASQLHTQYGTVAKLIDSIRSSSDPTTYVQNIQIEGKTGKKTRLGKTGLNLIEYLGL